MIDFYTAPTPNGKKVAIMLEELGVSYKEHGIDLKSNQQKSPEFLAINPNGKIPAIIDHEGPFNKKTTVFESGAILYYLAEKYGKFFGNSLDEKTQCMQWVMFQMSAIGPIFGNYYYGMNTLTPKNPGFVERFDKEAQRLLQVLDMHLSKNTYLAGNSYTIADIVTIPWIQGTMKFAPQWFEKCPSVLRWSRLVMERHAVKKVLL
jgi:GST-like protein